MQLSPAFAGRHGRDTLFRYWLSVACQVERCRTRPASFDLRGFSTTLSFNGEPSGNVFRHSSAQPAGSEDL